MDAWRETGRECRGRGGGGRPRLPLPGPASFRWSFGIEKGRSDKSVSLRKFRLGLRSFVFISSEEGNLGFESVDSLSLSLETEVSLKLSLETEVSLKIQVATDDWVAI